jgi:hypothetical protein
VLRAHCLPSLVSSKLAISREQTGLAGGLQKGFSRLAFAAPAIEGVPTDSIGCTPASAARPLRPLLPHAFDCFVNARNAALSRCRELENNRLGKPNIVHHFLLCSDCRLRASNRAVTGARLRDGWRSGARQDFRLVQTSRRWNSLVLVNFQQIDQGSHTRARQRSPLVDQRLVAIEPRPRLA